MKGRNFTIVIYSKDELDRILISSGCHEYAYILHDREEGTKPHYHLIMTYINAISLEELKKTLNLSYIEPVKSLKYMLLYLVHAENPDKITYAYEEVTGSIFMKMKLKNYLNNSTSSLNVELILEAKRTLVGNDFWNYLLQNNLSNCYLRYKSIIDGYDVSDSALD